MTSNSSKATRAGFLLLVVGAIVVGIWWWANTPSDTDTDSVVRVVYKANANYLIYFVAKENGYLRDAGLQVREAEMESTNLMIQALSSGQADFNPSASAPALYAAEQNAPGMFKFLFITLMESGRTNNAIIVRDDAPIDSLKDLRGKKVGSPPGATSLVLLKLIFADIGIDTANDLIVQELEPRTQLQALASGHVDALFAIEPIITLGAEKGISRVLEAEPMEKHVMDPIPIAGGVVSAHFAQSHPEIVARLKEAMERSIDFIRRNEVESRSIMAKAIGMPEESARRLGINTYWKTSEVDKLAVQSLADLFLQHGALESAVDTRAMYVGNLP